MSFAFTGNVRRLFLAANLHGSGSATTEALNIQDLATTGRLFLDLYLTTNQAPTINEANVEDELTLAGFTTAAGNGMALYNGAGYVSQTINVVNPEQDSGNDRIKFTIPTPDFDFLSLTAPSGGLRYLRYLIVTGRPTTGVGATTKIPLFAYDDGSVNGVDLIGGGDVHVNLPMALAINTIGV